MGNNQSSKEVAHRKQGVEDHKNQPTPPPPTAVAAAAAAAAAPPAPAAADAAAAAPPPPPPAAPPSPQPVASPPAIQVSSEKKKVVEEAVASPLHTGGQPNTCDNTAFQEPAGEEQGKEEVHTQPPQQSLVLNRLLELYTLPKEWGADAISIRLNTESLGEDVQNGVRSLAALIGFPSVSLDAGALVLGRPEGREEDRAASASARLGPRNAPLPSFLVGLDENVKEYVHSYLNEIVDEFAASGNPKYTVEARFLLPSAQVQELLHKLAKAKKLGASGWSLLGPGIEIPLHSATMSGLMDAGDSMTDLKTSPRVIPEGELVWRRLQHWCTNVRKEKKFNIWARNLDATIKQKIIDVALEVGFEAASVQPNGNIHVEIKPPADKQNRKRLRRPSPEVVEELIPVDKAVTENATAHMREWITDFAKSGKPRDTLNCRFALPADWIRKTATDLAEASQLKVVQETGIELIFSRTDMTEEEIEESLRRAKEEPKPSVQIGRSPRDSRISPRILNARLSPRNQNGLSRSRGRSRGDSRGRARGRGEYRSHTPPPNFGQHSPHLMTNAAVMPTPMNSMSMRNVHHTGGMPLPPWQERVQSFHSSPYANPALFGNAATMPTAHFGGHYTTQPHHVNRGGSHSSRMYRDEGYGQF